MKYVTLSTSPHLKPVQVIHSFFFSGPALEEYNFLQKPTRIYATDPTGNLKLYTDICCIFNVLYVLTVADRALCILHK